jgi:hypothetical protein
MIEEPWVVLALRKLGFAEGWAVCDEEIILWEHDEPQPTLDELKAAYDGQ